MGQLTLRCRLGIGVKRRHATPTIIQRVQLATQPSARVEMPARSCYTQGLASTWVLYARRAGTFLNPSRSRGGFCTLTTEETTRRVPSGSARLCGLATALMPERDRDEGGSAYERQVRSGGAVSFTELGSSTDERSDQKMGDETKEGTKACGGCLGAWCRRRTWLAAISVGELLASCDPAISEWGNPSPGKG